MPWITTIGLDDPRNLFFRRMASTAQGKMSIRRQIKRRYAPAFFQKLQAWLVVARQPEAVHGAGHLNIREDRANVIPAFQNTDGFIGIRCRDSFEPGLLHHCPACSGE